MRNAEIFLCYVDAYWLDIFFLTSQFKIVKQFRKEKGSMEASGSSSSQTTIQESVVLVSDEDPDHSICCGQLANSAMNLPPVALI
jgi:hypothetical protein